MFNGCHIAAALTEGRRVVETPGLFRDGRDDGIDVRPVEGDAVAWIGGMQDDVDVAAGVEPDSREPHSAGEGVLRAHSESVLHGGCHSRIPAFPLFSEGPASRRDGGVAESPHLWLFGHTGRRGRPEKNRGCYSLL